MVKYVKLSNEFQGFVASIANDITDDHEKKLINLILTPFDARAEAGTAHGRRGELLNELIQKESANISTTLLTSEKKESLKTFPFQTLSNLEVEDFRGFSKKEIIPIDKRFIFVYGPNGSGKSCFCEALEYAMLGYINEAITRL